MKAILNTVRYALACTRVTVVQATGAPAVMLDEMTQKYIVKNVDMPDEMQHQALNIARTAMQEFSIEKDVAAYIKKEFDEKHGPTWHCIVGRNYGSFVTHETKRFIYFYAGQTAILLFSSG